MISLRNLTKHYGGVAAVNGISFEVKEGEVCVIIGPSGCGKSTTLKMINRMLEPTSGEVFIGERNVKSMKPEVLRRRIGYVIQFVGLFPHMSVAENIGCRSSWDGTVHGSPSGWMSCSTS
jgi:osmoprotectant transport system ATP-binding protein